MIISFSVTDSYNFLKIGIEEYDAANDETASHRDLSTKDDHQQRQKQNDASFDQDHKRKRHGKFRRKG